MNLSVPGKFFLSGEYAALRGLPTITVAMQPEFLLKTSKKSLQFHPESPAGKIAKTSAQAEIMDPYDGVGGMGLSTAEFLMQTMLNNKGQIPQAWETLESYQKLFQGQDNVPSGVDMLTQLHGGYVVTDVQRKEITASDWPFSGYSWGLGLTGNKLKTHEHLKTDFNKLDWKKIEEMSYSLKDHFQNKNPDAFQYALKKWRQFLLDSGLEAETTTQVIRKINHHVLVAKGCGAMGSDNVFFIFKENHRNSVLNFVKPFFKKVLTNLDVSLDGLKVIESK